MRFYWFFVFAANLIVPLFFGLGMTNEGGRWGMATALSLIWFFGHMCCSRSKEMGCILVVGGLLVAITQIFPMLHIVAGMTSLGIIAKLNLAEVENSTRYPILRTELSGFIATLLTSIQLLVAACIGGVVLRILQSIIKPGTQPHI